MAPDIRFRVVSLPATVRSRKKSSSSISPSRSPSISTCVSALIRSSWGSRRFSLKSPSRVDVELGGRVAGLLFGDPVLGVLAPDHPVGPVEHRVTVRLGHPEQVGDDDKRELGGDVGDEVGLALLDHGVDDLVGGLVDLLLELGDHARGEALVHEPPVAGVQRRVHVEHEQTQLLDCFLGHVPDERAPSRPTRNARRRGSPRTQSWYLVTAQNPGPSVSSCQ